MKQLLSNEIQLSKNFKLTEFENSETARVRGIDNRIPFDKVRRIRALVSDVLQPIRDMIQIPIYISSGYRSLRLNYAVKGATNSQHVRAEAADIYINKDNPGRWSLWDVFNLIAKHTDFDQLIWEMRADGSKWIHVSYTTRRDNRNQCLGTKDGKTYYKIEF